MKKLSLLLMLAILPTSLTIWGEPSEEQRPQPPRKIEEDEPDPQGQATLRVAVEQIQVDVTVQDKNGNLVTGLSKGDFTVYEDKVQQEIATFAPVEAPMTAVLVVEYSKILPWEWLEEVWVASQIFARGMRQGDWIAVIAYDIRPEILADFTQNPADVFNALRRLNFPAFSESNLYDTVVDTLERLEEVEGKTAMILVSTGLDTFSKKNLGETLKAVKKTNVVIYPVSIGGNLRARAEHRLPSTQRMDFYQADAALKAFAKHTGGNAFFPRFMSAFRGIFEQISMLLRSQYSLSYVSSNPGKDGKFRKIKVDVEADINGDGKRDKLKVRHKDGYISEVG